MCELNVFPLSSVELFPIEVWGEIFRYLAPRDLLSCSNATPEWKELLAPKNASFMMPMAFSALAFRLSLHDLLTCRLVCRSWRDGVDNFFQAHPIHYTDVADHDLNHIHCPYEFCQFRPADLLKVERFLDEGDGNPKYNPFKMFRTVVFREGERDPIRGVVEGQAEPVLNQVLRLRAAFNRFLAQCGSEMWHCWMIFTDQGTTQEVIYLLVQSFLELMPNLKTLLIGVYGENFHRINLPQQQMSPQLMGLMQSYPLPVLKDLVKLNVDSVPTILEKEILAKHSNLRKLFWKSNTNHLLQDQGNMNDEREMKQLEVLRMYPFTRGNMARLNLPSLSFSLLRGLDLHVQNEDLGSVFQSVSRFGRSLRYLNLEFDGDIPQECSETLHLPLAETVKINAQFSNVRNIDFLLTCPSLKMLWLATSTGVVRRPDIVLPWKRWRDLEIMYRVSPSQSKRRDQRDDAGEVATVIRFDGCEESMYNSNIWEVFPMLESCKVFIRSDETQNEQSVETQRGLVLVTVNTTCSRFVYKRHEYITIQETSNENTNEENYFETDI